MKCNHDRMLVSMLLLGFNQERYIRQAIEGAFAQTYSPLEIILSDDGSQDQTFQIMREMVTSYHGPHKVILNQNPINLGPGGNLNRCIELSNGEWLVKADGDDVSLPERVEKIMELLPNEQNDIHLIYTGNSYMSNEGKLLRVNTRPQHGDLEMERDLLLVDAYVLGATCSWSRACATRFGPIDDKLHDDHVFPFRAKLLGSIVFLPLPLVNYRIYAGSTVASWQKPLTISSLFNLKEELRENLNHLRRGLETEARTVKQKIDDLSRVNSPGKSRDILKGRHKKLTSLLECFTIQSLMDGYTVLSRKDLHRGTALKILAKIRILNFLSTLG
jgi:glycosyltransferase involved in cell wall biosynthesis